MSWVKLDDRFPEHPKVLSAGPVGLAVHVRALCYAARNLTDGFIPTGVVPSLTADLGRVSRAAAASDWPAILVSTGLWDAAPGGYQIHDYLEFNPSREKVEAGRRAVADRVARWKKSHPSRGNASGNGEVTPLVTQEKRQGNGQANAAPVPHPLPVEEKKREPGEGARAPARRRKFTPPSLEEVRVYLVEIGARFTAERFLSHHEATGWTWGKARHPVKDWRAVARTWKARDDEDGAAPAPPPRPLVGAHPPSKEGPPSPPSAFAPAPAVGGVWPAILERLREVVDERDFDTWFRGTRQAGEVNGTLRVVVASELFREYVDSEYGDLIRDVAAEHGVDVPIEFVVGI